MATNKEIKINGVMTPVTEFDHPAQEIDDATTRALAGGAIDQLLAGKAPAGYGLGGSAPNVDDFNTAGANGWYGGNGSTKNGPDKIQYNGYGAVHVTRGGSTIVRQDFFMYDSVKFSGEMLATRASSDYGNTWTPWEYVNPPMLVGVEYRTTERYQGKPVYTKLVDCGSLPNAGRKTVNHDATVEYMLRCAANCTAGYKDSLPYWYDDNDYCTVYASTSQIIFKTPKDLSDRTANAQIWDTKPDT